MAQERYAPLVGTWVQLEGQEGPFRECRYCGGTSAKVVFGIGPHVGGLRCARCERHLSWIGKSHMDALLSKMGGHAA